MKCTEINQLPEEEINAIIDTVISHYYTWGFPFYKIDWAKIKQECEKLISFDPAKLELPDNHLQQNMMGLYTANCFHPEMWSIRCNHSRTPMEIFLDRKLFAIALRKRIKYSDTKLVEFNIRKSVKVFGAQSVSNFRPTIAKWVYTKFHAENVLDPCTGFGGRLLGAICSNIKSYTSTDPSMTIYQGNTNLYKALSGLELMPHYPKINLIFSPFEDFKTCDKYDLIFTSPPYFDIEKYSDTHNTQSYLRYPKYEIWKEKFLKVLIEKSYDYLLPGGHLVLNVGNPIIEDTKEIGSKIFHNNPEIYQMRLSKILGNGQKNNISHKTEPIFAWKKG